VPMHLLAALVGAVAIGGTLVELFETVVLPRRITRRFRLTPHVTRMTLRLWRRVAGVVPRIEQELLSALGPLVLFVLLAVWAVGLIVGFALLHWGNQSHLTAANTPARFVDDLYFSGTTFFTLGLGDLVPRGATARLLTVLEAATGFGVLAMVIGYLPALYQAFARREVAVSLLDARAGSPPSAGALLRHYARSGRLDRLFAYLAGWESWAADLMESHLSYPVLCYFRSQHDNQSWLAALTTILDACALVMAGFPDDQREPAALTFAMGRHFVVDIAQVLRIAPHERAADRLPADDLARLRELLAEAGSVLPDAPVVADTLRELRALYEPYVQALAHRLAMPVPAWLPPAEVREDWRATAWDREREIRR
jgi:hypothetical protein